jgi:hypothetical protein
MTIGTMLISNIFVGISHKNLTGIVAKQTQVAGNPFEQFFIFTHMVVVTVCTISTCNWSMNNLEFFTIIVVALVTKSRLRQNEPPHAIPVMA